MFLAAHLGDALAPVHVGAEHQEARRLGDPGHGADHGGNRLLLILVGDDDGVLLQVRFGGCGLGRRQKGFQHAVGDRFAAVMAAYPATDHAGHGLVEQKVRVFVAGVEAEPAQEQIIAERHVRSP